MSEFLCLAAAGLQPTQPHCTQQPDKQPHTGGVKTLLGQAAWTSTKLALLGSHLFAVVPYVDHHTFSRPLIFPMDPSFAGSKIRTVFTLQFRHGVGMSPRFNTSFRDTHAPGIMMSNFLYLNANT